jgi:hypothetical protein
MPPLAEYLDRKEAQRHLANHYPTEQSFAWFVRRHRDHLAANGAMIVVAGRQKFHPALTEQVVLAVGRRDAIGERGE